MFLVVIIKRARKSKHNPNPAIIGVTPVGTAFAISESHAFTAAHNVDVNGRIDEEIGLLREYEDPVCVEDIVVASYLAHCADGDEDWAIFERVTGTFAHYAHVCPEAELPVKNDTRADLIGVRDFPVGLLTALSSDKLTVQSFHTKVAQYEVFTPVTASTKKRTFKGGRVVQSRPPKSVERALQVVGGRVKGRCGAAYFAGNGKVVAFHVESLDDGSDSISESNTYTSDRSHTSFSRGLVLCRLEKFRVWYNATVAPILGTNPL